MARVEVVFSARAREVEVVALVLPEGATVRDALQASGLLQRQGVDAQGLLCGVWGRRCALSRRLREGDRVELYRPLTVDPKEARRLRYKGQRKAKRPAVPGAGETKGSKGAKVT